jgi:hypothetical protein
MPKTKISEYSATNSANTDIEGINIDEGCPPSSINNAIREVMVHLKEFQTGASGDAFTFAGGTLMTGTNTISGAAVISGNINSSGTTNTFSGGVVHSGTNTFSSSLIISGNINSSGTTNTFSGGNVLSGTNTFSGTNVFSSDVTLNAQSDLRFADSDSSNWVAFQSPATVASNVTWTLPAADGTSNQVLATDGSGTLSWATAGGGASISAGDSKVEVTDTGSNGTIVFNTDNAERMRVNASGQVLIGATSAVSGTDANGRVQVSQNIADGVCILVAENTASSGNLSCIRTRLRNSSPNSVFSAFVQGDDSTTQRFTLRSDGGLANYSANNANLSDRREKKDFSPAKSYLETICAIPVQTFNYIDQGDDLPNLGVVAQDVQAVAPELVSESDWSLEKDGSKMRLSVYQTDLQYALMKSIQELKAINDAQATRIETLETKVAALEAN